VAMQWPVTVCAHRRGVASAPSSIGSVCRTDAGGAASRETGSIATLPSHAGACRPFVLSPAGPSSRRAGVQKRPAYSHLREGVLAWPCKDPSPCVCASDDGASQARAIKSRPSRAAGSSGGSGGGGRGGSLLPGASSCPSVVLFENAASAATFPRLGGSACSRRRARRADAGGCGARLGSSRSVGCQTCCVPPSPGLCARCAR
jgi:hypothetical protein